MPRPLVLAMMETKRFLLSRSDLALGIVLPIVVFAVIYFGFGDLLANGEGADHLPLVPAVLTAFLLLSVTLAAQSLPKERRNGTLERLLSTRLRINELFIGRFLGGLARGIAQAAFLLALAFLVFRPGGLLSYLQVLFFAAVFAGAVSGIAMLLAALARTRTQGVLAALLVTGLMALFGGAFFRPAEGTFLDTLSYFTVTKHATEGLGAIMTQGHLGAAGMEAATLGTVLVASLALARWAFRVSPILRSARAPREQDVSRRPAQA
jgi:ABC-2 type transport system permease protein